MRRELRSALGIGVGTAHTPGRRSDEYEPPLWTAVDPHADARPASFSEQLNVDRLDD